MKAIILAGGRGTRFSPITDTVPKALLPINGSTLLELVLTTLPGSIDTVIITTKYLGNLIEEKIGTTFNNKNVLYAPQPQDSAGTWSAFYATKDFIMDGEQFLVINCDDVFEKAALTTIVDSKKNGMGVTKRIMPAKYHAVLISEEGLIQGLQRHPNIDREELVEDTFANGLFVLDSKAFSFPPVALIDGELGLPQTILKQLERYPMYAHHMDAWLPCNTVEDLEKIKNATTN